MRTFMKFALKASILSFALAAGALADPGIPSQTETPVTPEQFEEMSRHEPGRSPELEAWLLYRCDAWPAYGWGSWYLYHWDAYYAAYQAVALCQAYSYSACYYRCYFAGHY